jgi:putative membrane protein
MVEPGDDGGEPGRDQLVLRDHLAADRTQLANERTFLAYLRTALSFLASGGAVLVFFDGNPVVAAGGYAFVALALVSFAVGLYKYISMKRRIEEEKVAVEDSAMELKKYLQMRRLGMKGELKK